jgi:RNase P/RNase MRP subunit p29
VSETAEDMVTLRDGPTVAVDAVKLVFDLEARDIAMRVDGGDLVVRPRQKLTAQDVERLRLHRDDLLRIAVYEAPKNVA